MGHKADSANVGCKVLPICDAVSTGSSNGGYSSDGSERDAPKGERRRAVSQMKELLKWAAAARSHKGSGSKGWKISYFRNRVRHHLVEGGCSSSSSMNSSLSLASMSGNDRIMLVKNSSNLSGNLRSSECTHANLLASPMSEEYVRPGRWITTDSDFVVLEL